MKKPISPIFLFLFLNFISLNAGAASALFPVNELYVQGQLKALLVGSIHVGYVGQADLKQLPQQLRRGSNIYFEHNVFDPHHLKTLRSAISQLKLSDAEQNRFRSATTLSLRRLFASQGKSFSSLLALQDLHPFVQFQTISRCLGLVGKESISIDEAIFKATSKHGLIVGSLEDPAELASDIASVSVEEWIVAIKQAATFFVSAECESQILNHTKTLSSMVDHCDYERVATESIKFTSTGPMSEAVFNQLLMSARRNERLAKKILDEIAKLDNGIPIFVVGAMHLAPSSGIAETLERAGVSIKWCKKEQ
jgi:uncharacterized protein YbaP (TraB family)